MRSVPRAAIRLLLCAVLTAAVPATRADAWCDVVFKDVARSADIVLLAQVDKKKGEAPGLRVVEVFKGACEERTLNLQLEELAQSGVKDRDHVLLALTREMRLANDTRGLGACFAITVLPIRDGKLRARDRVNYDSRRGTMTLDELREELIHHLADG